MAGAVAVIALAVIFVPMLFEGESLAPPSVQSSLPPEPDFDHRAGSEPAPGLTTDPMAEPMDDGLPVESEPPMLPAPSTSAEAYPGSTTDDEFDGEPDQNGQAQNAVRNVSPSEQPGQIGRPSAKPPRIVKGTDDAAPGPSRKDDGMPSWIVQVASVGTAQGAAELEQKLRNAGFSAFVEKAEVRGKQYYRVRVGPEVDRESAERAATKLRQQQKLDTLIQRYP
ncbi:SPOR domain-containing protein [Thiocystis minor]|uniref:SPOR domain-containing protein n=1 Tax=Thiocystis minor TaxID=61597 RepID=UPI001913A057|nr:SPOR domain-containing protein [Thiocystis minor]